MQLIAFVDVVKLLKYDQECCTQNTILSVARIIAQKFGKAE